MKRKLLTVVVVFLLVFSMTACAGTPAATDSQEPAQASEQPSESAEQPQQAEGEPVKLRVLVMTEAEDRKVLVDEWYSKYKDEFPNFEVEFDEQAKTYGDKLKVYCSSGDMPDVFWCFNDVPVTTGNAMDLTQKIVDDGFADQYKSKSAIIPYSDGKVYAIGAGTDSYYLPQIWYNKTIFADAGVEVPTTYGEFVEACKKLKDAGYTPFSMAPWAASELLTQALVTTGDSKAMTDLIQKNVSWTDESIVAGLDKFKELVDIGIFPQNAGTISWDGAAELFNSGKAAMWYEPTWAYSSIALEPEELDFFLMPTDSGSKDIVGWGSFAGGFSVSANTKYPEEALKFAEWMTMQDAKYFEGEKKMSAALETGITIEDVPEILQKNDAVVSDPANNIIPNVSTLWGATAFTELQNQCGKMLTGQVTGQEFADAMAKVWQ